MYTKRRLATVLTLASVALPAQAHISLERGGTHMSRYGDEMIKDGPCGAPDGERGTYVYTYQPGETITVRVVEFVPHPGYFRIAFDPDGDDDFADPVSIAPLDPARGCPADVLVDEQKGRDQCNGSDFYNNAAVLPGMDNLMPHVTAPADTVYEFEVTLPDVECERCTLQIIQVMEDAVHGPYNVEVAGLLDAGDIYYQCIDLVLTRDAQPADAGTEDAGTADAGTHDSGAVEAGSETTPPGAEVETGASDSGGCSAGLHRGSSGAAGIGWLLAVAALAVTVCRRREATRSHGSTG